MNSRERSERRARLVEFVREAWPRVALRIAACGCEPGLRLESVGSVTKFAWRAEAATAKNLGLYSRSTYDHDIGTTLYRIACEQFSRKEKP